jgi:superfamily II DNA or RNA helicase
MSHPDLHHSFDSNALIRGRAYFEAGKVLSMNLSGDFVRGSVSGSGLNKYQQEIEIISRRPLIVSGDCTCPVEFNCKHVAAVMLRLLSTEAHNSPGLNHVLSNWIDYAGRLCEQRRRELTQTKPPQMTLGLLLSSVDGKTGSFSVCRPKVNAQGQLVSAAVIRTSYGQPAELAQVADPELKNLIRSAISHAQYGYSTSNIRLSGTDGYAIVRNALELEAIYHTVRQAGSKARAERMRAGPPRTATLGWRKQGNAPTLELALEFDDGTPVGCILPTDPPMYFCGLELGILQLSDALRGLGIENVRKLVESAPAVPESDIALLSSALAQRGLIGVVPTPQAASALIREGIAPTPCLILGARDSWMHEDDIGFTVEFDYDGCRTGTLPPSANPSRQTAAGAEVILRDLRAEEGAVALLEGFGMFMAEHQAGAMYGYAIGSAQVLALYTRVLPDLRGRGWQIEAEPGQGTELAQVDEWYAEAEEDSQWFNLELGVIVNQERVPLLPILLDALRRQPRGKADQSDLLATLPGGGRVVLPWTRVQPILSVLEDLYTPGVEKTLTLPAHQAARLAQLEQHVAVNGAAALREVGRKLAGFEAIAPAPLPTGLQAPLRHYQHEGLSWMQFLREYGLGGILADDMGLGKTVQTLAHILLEKEQGRLTAPALVVAPTSLMDNWQAEAARFTPGLRVLALTGAQRSMRFGEINEHDLVLSSYPLLLRDADWFTQQRFHLVVLDESQYIKNPKAKAALVACKLQSSHRLCLSGTPVQNHLGELWSQFHFLMPGLLGSERHFGATFRKPIEKQGDQQRGELLRRHTRPFMLRRTKDLVAKELPPKTEMLRVVELSGAQRDLYETVRLAMDKKVRAAIASKGLARSQIIMLDALLKLRQVCCDPKLVKLPGNRKPVSAPSAKLEELLAMIDELREEGRRMLVFSQFTSMLEIIGERLREREIDYCWLTGESVDRGEQVARFQQGAHPVFLISLKAGGVGLNLTAADTVIHFDPWWNPAAENQATDRSWRIGQEQPVFVYKLIAKGTVEERIQELQRKKGDLAAAVLDDGTIDGIGLKAEDLQMLLTTP